LLPKGVRNPSCADMFDKVLGPFWKLQTNFPNLGDITTDITRFGASLVKAQQARYTRGRERREGQKRRIGRR
jgi:hypothetical protein